MSVSAGVGDFLGSWVARRTLRTAQHPVKFDINCPWCGHRAMFYGEPAELYGEVRRDVFSCRGCGSAYDAGEIAEVAAGYAAALAAVGHKEGAG